MFKNMTACNSYEIHNIYPNINDQQQFKLNKINQIKMIGMMNSQRNDTEKVNLIEESKKKIGINEAIKHNEIIDKSLKFPM